MTKGKATMRAPHDASVSDDDEDGHGHKNYITALARGLAVMRAFAHRRDHITLTEMSRLVNLPRATVRRCLITLNTLGYVETTGKYFRLTPHVLTLSQAYFTSSPLPNVARPFIEQASKAAGESCSLSVLTGDQIIYIARSTRRRVSSVQREIGVNAPAYCSSMGRVLLANLGKNELSSYFRRVKLEKFTNKTIVDEAKLRAILQRVREDDFCIIDGEREDNLRAIAVPVRNAIGMTVAALNISTESNRTTLRQIQNDYLPVLRRATSQIRGALVG